LAPTNQSARQADGQNSFLTAKDLALLDSIRHLSQQYEAQADYMAAYAAEVKYLSTRNELKKKRLSAMMDQQLKNSKSKKIDLQNLQLKKQNAQMELQMLEGESETMRVRSNKDSIKLLNDKLMRENWENATELQRKQMLREDELRTSAIAQKRMKLTMFISILFLSIIVILLCAVHIMRLRRDYKALKQEKKTVDRALRQAQEADRAHDTFMHNLSDEIRQPLDVIVNAANENADTNCTPDKRCDNMTLINLNTDKLIKAVNDIIDKVEMSAGEKIMTVLLLIGSFCLTANAQKSNPFGLRDDLYQYYMKCERAVQSPDVIPMTDTLIGMAHKEKNKLLECLAYDVRVGHSFFSHDLDKIHAAQKEALSFIRTTSYNDYIFYVWNRSIITSISQMNYANAARETRAYQKEALKLKNIYGITKGFYYMGEVYYQRGMEKEALEQYSNAIEAAEAAQTTAKRNLSISYSYSRIGEIYMDNGEYAKAERYLKQASAAAIYNYEKVNPTLRLFRLYVLRGRSAEAAEMQAKIEQMDREKLIYNNRRDHYLCTLIRLYAQKGDYDKVREYISQTDGSDYETIAMAYATMGEYQKAMETMRHGISDTEQKDKSLNLALISALQNEYETDLGEIQNSRLALQNTLLQVEQLKRQNELSAEQHLQDSTRLSNNRLLMESRITSDSLMAAERNLEESWLQNREMDLRNKRNMVILAGIVLLALMTFMIADTQRRRYMNAHLMREKAEAIEACRLAEEAVERKRLFLEQVTHEIRTPLNHVVGFNQVLCDDDIISEMPPEEVASLREQSNTGTESLKKMIDAALELCDLESGKVQVTRVSTDLNSLCDSVAESYRPKAKRGVTIVCHGDKLPPITTDSIKLRKALSVLLDNACKFTTEGSITLDRSIEGDLIHLSVTDTGCGIPADQAEAVFGNFVKIDSFVPGIGLGLPLCRSLTRLIGGEVSIDTSYTNGVRAVITFATEA
jgi:signal transduction histidine kinase